MTAALIAVAAGFALALLAGSAMGALLNHRLERRP